MPVAPADEDSGEADADSEVDEVGVLELEALLPCEVEVLIKPEAVAAAVLSELEESASLEEESSLSSLSEKSSEVGDALFEAVDVLVADPVTAAAALPVAAVSGTAVPAEHVISGTPLMMPWLGSPRQQVKSLASLLLPVPPIREPSQQ